MVFIQIIISNEHMTISLQVHCTNIYIGVHGAGMEWYQFLPKDGALFELGWYRWRANQWWDLARRRGLLAEKMEAAQNVTINWNYVVKGAANWTKEEKQKYIGKSAKIADFNGANPFKNADAVFSVHRFTLKLLNLVNGLEEKFGVPFRSPKLS